MSDITHAFMLRGKQSSGRQHIMNELRSESRESFWALYRQVAFAIGEPAIPNIQSELDEMLQRPAGTLDRERIEQWMQSMRDMQEQLREREEVITTLKVDIDELRRWIAANEAAVV